jgi:hypothetical protein
LFRRRKLFSLNVKGGSRKKNERKHNLPELAKHVSEKMCRHFLFQKYVELTDLYPMGMGDLNPHTMGLLAVLRDLMV